MNLYKDIFKRGSTAFQIGAQAYNVLNHVNFGPPGNNASNLSTLGVISSDIGPPTSPYGSASLHRWSLAACWWCRGASFSDGIVKPLPMEMIARNDNQCGQQTDDSLTLCKVGELSSFLV